MGQRQKDWFCCDGTKCNFANFLFLSFQWMQLSRPRREKDWWLKRNFNYFPFIFKWQTKEKKKNTISKQLAMPDRSSVVPKEQTKLVLIKQTPRARGSHQKEGGGAVMATKLFFSYLYIQRGIWGRRRRKDSIEEGKEKERRLISHCLSPFCLCLRPRQRQIMLTLWVCILEHSSVMNAGQLTDITA